MALLVSTSLTALAATITAVPPVTYVPPPSAKSEAEPRPLVPTPSRVIRLQAPTAAELSQLKVANQGSKRTREKGALAIGIPRDVADGMRGIRGSSLVWLPSGNGVSARVDVASTGAAAIRVALAAAYTDPDVTVRFAGGDGTLYGPFPLNRVAGAAASEGTFWSPVIQGDTAIVEIHAPAGVDVAGIEIDVLRISHLVLGVQDLRSANAQAKALAIGAAGSCELDIACVSNPSQALLTAAKSVAEYVVTDPSGRTFQCTGTLLNDSTTSLTPYFYSASHCINSQARASSMNTYWFFDAVACNSKAVPQYRQLTGGATLLGRSEDYDWVLVRLREAPPAGATFSAWRAEPVASGTTAFTIHHPEGDLKKWSQGVAQGYETYDDGSTFIRMVWSTGSTEPGSSGAGLFTPGSGGAYELRGGLFGGAASCSNRTGVDVFSRLDKAAPLMRQYLTPNVPEPNGQVIVVEFYNAALDHYFISSNPAEINDLDTGVHPGWVRTGFRFAAYGNPALAPAGATPVCRFYLSPAVGDSHFYSGDPAECAATAARFGASWTLESAAVFHIVLPDRVTGACPAGHKPVFRFFHSSATNHRYTAEVDVRDDLAGTSGWIAEGYGPDSVIMCSPDQ